MTTAPNISSHVQSYGLPLLPGTYGPTPVACGRMRRAAGGGARSGLN